MRNILLAVVLAAGCATSGYRADLMESHQILQDPGPDLDGDGVPNDLAWREAGPIDVRYSPALPDTYVDALRAAVNEVNGIIGWGFLRGPMIQDSRVANLTDIGGAPPPDGIIYFDIDEGLTFLQGGESHVRRLPDGSIVGAESSLPEPSRTEIDIRKVALHELLHDLGVNDSSDRDSIMCYKLKSNEQPVPPEVRVLLIKMYGAD